MRRVAGLWRRLFGARERDALAPLYHAVVAAARRPVWYKAGGVPDTIDGRFDMVAAILALVLLRLEEEGDVGRAPAAYLAELFVDDMDGQLRERGIGDIVVGKHVGRMMGALGGRLGAFRDGFGAGGDLDTAIRRNIYRGAAPAPGAVAVVRDGLVSMRATLEATPASILLDGVLSA
ncbi:ubiquinol-cytochrome C chaperone family protein [Sphingomonas nostoxanthinifaciens]|uniref:ubiquinol-cytochrome C chaperone family protein n=1 Tax=Sphingomonas nostoxanthinifaciens TaxID=2872652 RepID=UPI001CC1CAD0|nr:ubiquinol-cytochrome C chaperone family protein [Sphingomonas nostoxanthinifaciens]UAK25015.1 ubiquinol-cytochrome C chaperone [Sphingomonas nostoxanthinifaciens]